jgi:hypothetical protein
MLGCLFYNKQKKRMKKITHAIFLIALVLASKAGLKAQGTDNYGAGLKFNLDSTGKKFVRMLTWHQVWVRHNENNPGSTVNGEASSSQWDMSMRRSRFLMYAQINPNFLILTHFGINNSNQVSGGAAGQGATGTDGKKPQLFLHDAWVEHRVFKDNLSIGAGLHYWQGPSRLSSGSTLNFLAIDAPIFNWQNIEATDQFARQFGIFAKGKLLKNKRIDYRMSVNFPYALAKGTAFTTLDTTAAKNNVQIANYKGGGQPKNSYQGYFQYQFWDVESNLLPFTVGSYLGTKKVFNLGLGAYYQPDAMWSAKQNTTSGKWDTALHKQLFVTADVFLDMPLKYKNMAVTFYGAYNYFNMGPNYVRNIGIDNPTNGTIASQVAFNGGGNTMPTTGTGNIYYAQAGLLLPKSKTLGKFQPYGAITVSQFERLKDNVVTPDMGINWFLNGHSAKVTLNYRMRPVYKFNDPTQRFKDVIFDTYKGELTIQFQIYL